MTALGCASSATGMALLVATALAAQQQAPAHDARAYLPLTPGTTWVYAVEHPAAPALTKIRKVLTRVLHFNDAPVIELGVRCSDPAFPIVPFEYYVASREGLESLPLMGGTVGQWVDWSSPATLLLPCPHGAGAEWDTQIVMNALDPRFEPVHGSLIEERRLVQVPATATECAYVRFERRVAKRFRRRHVELAPGIGVVREVFEVEGQPALTIALEQFRRADPPARIDGDQLVREIAGGRPTQKLAHAYLGSLFESQFVRIDQGTRSSLVRVWRGRATPFAAADLTSVQALLRDEGIALLPMPGGFSSHVPPLLAALALLDVAVVKPMPPDTVPAVTETRVSYGGDIRIRARFSIGAEAQRQVTIRLEAHELAEVTVEQ